MTSQTNHGIWHIPRNGQDGNVDGAEPELLGDGDSQLSHARDLLPGDASGELLALTTSSSGGGAGTVRHLISGIHTLRQGITTLIFMKSEIGLMTNGSE